MIHMTIEDAIDELTYRSYAHRRRLAPEISPERWATVLSNVPEMEQRYQLEIMSQQPGCARAEDQR
jgi:hypothetical protein